RIILGAHDPRDVVAGLALGGGWTAPGALALDARWPARRRWAGARGPTAGRLRQHALPAPGLLRDAGPRLFHEPGPRLLPAPLLAPHGGGLPVAGADRHALQELVGRDLHVLGGVAVAGVLARLVAPAHVHHALHRGAGLGGHALHRRRRFAIGLEATPQP